VRVELLGGRGEDLWPYPGRVFAVGPSHTFMDLASAINGAFARWDRSHLSMFTLADGRVVTDRETGAEMAASMGGPIRASLDIESAGVARTTAPGAEFQFIFDLGDSWTHRCGVGVAAVVLTAGIGPGSATGTVAFRDGGVAVPGCAAMPVSGGQAQCVTTFATAGAHPITTAYSGDGVLLPATATTTVDVTATPNLFQLLLGVLLRFVVTFHLFGF